VTFLAGALVREAMNERRVAGRLCRANRGGDSAAQEAGIFPARSHGSVEGGIDYRPLRVTG